MSSDDNAEEILTNYKRMVSECQQIASKIGELSLEKDEHKLVIDTLEKLEPDRRAFRLIGGILVEKPVGEALPAVKMNYEGLQELIVKLEASLKTKDSERKQYKEKHGIMTQEEREKMMKMKSVPMTTTTTTTAVK